MASPSPLSSLLALFSLSLLLLSSAAFQPPSSAASPADSGFSPSQEQHQATLLGAILANLGFQELAMAVPALVPSASAAVSSGPVTVFSPSDDSIRSCTVCSPAALLREHLVPGLFTKIHLSNLAFGTKLETTSPGRCLTVTSTAPRPGSNSSSPADVKIFVDGVEVTAASPLPSTSPSSPLSLASSSPATASPSSTSSASSSVSAPPPVAPSSPSSRASSSPPTLSTSTP